MSTRKSAAKPAMPKVSAVAVRDYLQQSAEFPSWSLDDLAKALGLGKTEAKHNTVHLRISTNAEKSILIVDCRIRGRSG